MNMSSGEQHTTGNQPADDCAAQQAIIAYDQQRVEEMLRTWTPQQLQHTLRAGNFDQALSGEERAELDTLLHDWVQRALGMVMLRDALLVDQQRGERVYALLCQGMAADRWIVPPGMSVPAEMIASTGETFTAQQLQHAFSGEDSQHAGLSRLLADADQQGLSLAWQQGTAAYVLPASLEMLVPPVPAPYTDPALRFEPPIGWRRAIAVALVMLGVGVFGVPLLIGAKLAQPAGLPLALLTLGLLIGIRAGWAGYIGSFCIWLVPNLPGFHHDTPLAALPKIIPLLLVGLVLLACDRRVRALWRWIRLRGRA
jgi:hypothetical protein